MRRQRINTDIFNIMSGSDKCFKRKTKHVKELESNGEGEGAVVAWMVRKSFSLKLYQEEGTMLSQISQIEKDKYCILSLLSRI